MIFEQMDEVHRRLHNASLVLEAEGDDNGFAKLQIDAIYYIEKLKCQYTDIKNDVAAAAIRSRT